MMGTEVFYLGIYIFAVLGSILFALHRLHFCVWPVDLLSLLDAIIFILV